MKSVLYKNLSEDPTDPALSALRLGISDPLLSGVHAFKDL
jgi:hypothetical protein